MPNKKDKLINSNSFDDIHKYFLLNQSLIKKNTVLFNQNEESSGLYFILSGIVGISKTFNRERILKTAIAGDIIGFESFTGGVKYSATATVLEDAVVSNVSSKEINTIVKQNSYICFKLLIKLYKYLITHENRISVIAFKTIAENLNEILVEINKEKNTNQDIVISNNYIKKRNKTQRQKPAAHLAKPNYFQNKIKQIICL